MSISNRLRYKKKLQKLPWQRRRKRMRSQAKSAPPGRSIKPKDLVKKKAKKFSHHHRLRMCGNTYHGERNKKENGNALSILFFISILLTLQLLSQQRDTMGSL